MVHHANGHLDQEAAALEDLSADRLLSVTVSRPLWVNHGGASTVFKVVAASLGVDREIATQLACPDGIAQVLNGGSVAVTWNEHDETAHTYLQAPRPKS